MYYNLGGTITGKRGELIHGDHYDVTAYLGEIHKDINNRYTTQGEFDSSYNSAAYDIEYALNAILNSNYKKISLKDKLIKEALLEQLPSDLKNKILNFKSRYQGILKEETVSSSKVSSALGTEFEEDLEALFNSIFSTEKGQINSLVGAESVVGSEMANDYFNELKESFEPVKLFIDTGVKTTINNILKDEGVSSDDRKKKASDEIRHYMSYSLGLEVSDTGFLNVRLKKGQTLEENTTYKIRRAIQSEMDNFFENCLGGSNSLKSREFKLAMLNSPGADLSFSNSALGKVDITIDKNALLFNINTSFEVDDSRLIKGLNAMKGKNFSLKVTGKKKKIKIGDSIFSKVYFDFLPNFTKSGDILSLRSGYRHLHYLTLKNASNPNSRSKNRFYYDEYNHPNSKGGISKRWQRIREEIYYIRAMYELTGLGQKSKDDETSSFPESTKNKPNDYLIYMTFDWANDSSKNKDRKAKGSYIKDNYIKVRSASQIYYSILKEIEKNKAKIGVGELNPFHGAIELDPNVIF